MIPDLHDLAHVAGWGAIGSAWSRDIFPLLDLYYTDPAQRLIMAGLDLHDLCSDLSDLSVRRIELLR